MRGHLTRAGRRLALIATATVLAAVTVGATAAPSFATDLRVTTTTTLVASPSALDPSGTTTLTASVRPGLFVGPLGKIKFTDSTNGAVLGTVAPKLTCLLRREPCVATITVPGSALAAGDNTIVAAYSGGLFTKPSSGSADVFVGTQTTCQAGGPDCSTTVSADQTTATIDTTPPASGPAETVQAFLDNEPSPCANPGAGDTLVYSVTNPGGQTKTITLVFTGSAADQEHQLDPFSIGNVCFFESPSSFQTAAPNVQAFQAADGTFFGNLPLCDDNDGDDNFANGESHGKVVVPVGTFPCINFVSASDDTWSSFTPGATSAQDTYTESFTTTASDPKAHG
jgi:hypothetical protein